MAPISRLDRLGGRLGPISRCRRRKRSSSSSTNYSHSRPVSSVAAALAPYCGAGLGGGGVEAAA
uniref:Uncharacterized protein n=1 Tax=Arundo donax TaxID=35708 RepID=A0A0A9FQM2_ARUDO